MTDDVPAQLVLHPPTTDIECTSWGSLAPTLYHAGLIWRDYSQVVVDDGGLELRVCCTFTDRWAFESWRSNPLVVERCSDLLATPIEVCEIWTPWAKHDKICACPESDALILRGHGFGNTKAILYCNDCLGYFPDYRFDKLRGDFDLWSSVKSWAVISKYVYKIWLMTGELEDWAWEELADPASDLNAAGLQYTASIGQVLERPVWYSLFVPHDDRNGDCPKCGATCESPRSNSGAYRCRHCRIIY